MRKGLVLALLVAALAGCGGDDAEEETTADQDQQEAVAQLESRLKESINRGPTAKEDPRRKGVPDVEEVDCPDDVDLSAIEAEYVCQISGGGETGRVGILVTAEDTFNYGGGFGEVGEFGQGITLEPPEEDPGGGGGGGGSAGGEQSGSGQKK